MAINVRPALIPEKIRPQVLKPIYLVRTVIKVLFWIAWACLVLLVVILAPIPLLQDIVRMHFAYKIILSLAILLLVFGPAAKYLQWIEQQVLALIDRVERLASGDILEAAALAFELSQGVAGMAADQTLRRARQSQEAAEQLAIQVNALSLRAYNNSQKATKAGMHRATQGATHATKFAAQSTSRAAHATANGATQATTYAAHVTANAAHDVADEATHLLQSVKEVRVHKPDGSRIKNMGQAGINFTKSAIRKPDGTRIKHLGQTGVKLSQAAATNTVKTSKAVATHTVETTKTAGQVLVHGEEIMVSNVGRASNLVYDTGLKLGNVAVDNSSLAAHQTFAVVQTAQGAVLVVASAAVQAAMDNLQKLLQLNPIVLFKRVVKLVLKALFYLVIGAPIMLWVLGKVLWKLGIQPSALEALCLAWFLALVVCPVFLYVRWRALEQLNHAGGELLHRSMQRDKEKQAKQAAEDAV